MVSAAGVSAASAIQSVSSPPPIRNLCLVSNDVGSVAPNVNQVNVPAFLQQPDELPLRATWRSVGAGVAPKLFELCTAFPPVKKRKAVDKPEVGMAARAAINAYNNPPSTSTIVQDRLGMYVDLYHLQLASLES